MTANRGRGSRGGGRGGSSSGADRGKDKRIDALVDDEPAVPSASNVDTNNNNTAQRDGVVAIPIDQPVIPEPPLVTIRIFVYFLCDLKKQPEVELVDYGMTKIEMHGTFQDHCMWVEMKVLAGREVRFRLKVGNYYENNPGFFQSNYRTIHADIVKEGMLYVDFNNQLFDNSYLKHTVHFVGSMAPFEAVALFLASRCYPAQYEHELRFLFGKMKDKTSYTVQLMLDIHEFFQRLVGLATSHLIAKEEVFVKGVIFCKVCNDSRIYTQSKFFPPDIIKDALPVLELNPQYVTIAIDAGLLHDAGRAAKGLFYLVAALTWAYVKRVDNPHLLSFKLQASTKLTDNEIDLLSKLDWSRYPTFGPSELCGCLAIAAQINQVAQVVPHLTSRGLLDYKSVLNDMKCDDYLQEWKYCLQFSPQINIDKIPFALNSVKFRNAENKPQPSIDDLPAALLQAENSPQRRTWAKHLKGELQVRIARLFPVQHQPQQHITSLLGVVRGVAEDKLLLLEFHDMLPKLIDRTLKQRIKELLNCTVPQLIDLEKKAIFAIFDSMAKEILVEYHKVLIEMLTTPKHPILIEIYIHCWARLVKFVIGDLQYSIPKQMCILKSIRSANDNRDSDLFYYLFFAEVTQLFDQAYDLEAVPERMEALVADAETLAQRINDKDVLPEVIPVLAEEHVIDRLQVLAQDTPVEFVELKKHYNLLKEQWTSFLGSLNIMRGCEEFKAEAEAESALFGEEYKALESARVVSKWTAPDCSPQLRIVSERLTKLKDSEFFSYGWKDPSLGKGYASAPGKSLTERWVAYFQVYYDHWRDLVTQIGTGRAPVTTIEQLFAYNLNQLGPRFKGKVLHSTEAEARQQIEQLQRTTKEEIEKIVGTEVDLFILLTNAQLEKAVVFQRIHQCITALAMLDDISALQELAAYLKMELNVPAVASFCKLRANANDRATTQYQQVVLWYEELINILPNIKNLIQGFPSLFLDVIFKHDLLKVVSFFSDVASLNARIDTRQGEDIREETHDVLHAMRLLCDGRSILSHPLFQKIRTKAAITLQQLLDFFVKCGSAVVALAILQDKMSKGGNQVVHEALQSDSEEKQTITIVKNLLVNGGSFAVEVKNGTVFTSAVYKDPTRPLVDKIRIGPEELEALPSQLLLTSGVTTKNQATFDVDAPLPENIARLEDRERYVLRFNALFDTAFQLASVVQSLCHAGHPDYQDLTITLDCNLAFADFVQYVHAREELLLKWMNTFAAFRESHPILSFLSRSQLVSCLSALRTQRVDLLYSTLQSIGCNPSLMSVSLLGELHGALNVNNAAGLFKILSACLERYFDVEKLQNASQGAANLPAVLNPLSAITSPIRLVRVTSEHNLEEVVCAAHISLHRRTPSPIEILFCSSRTTAVDVEDFLDRWMLFTQVNAHSIGNAPVTFWLVKMEELPYPIQSSCMQKLFKILETLPQNHPKLFFVIKGTQKTYVSNILVREETEFKHETCAALSVLIQPIAASLNNIYVVHSKHCGEGKTTSVLRKLVCDKKNNGHPVVHVQASVDTTPMDVILKRLLKARPMMSEQGVVLHFNVGHQANAKEVNLFLFQYLLVSSWRDNHGFTFPRHGKDTIVIELCNTGKEDERERITICKYFQELPLLTGISHVKLDPIPSPISKLFYSFAANHEVHEVGTQMLIANFQAMKRGLRVLPFKPEIVGTTMVGEVELFDIMASVAANNWCTQRHLMLWKRTTANGNPTCAHCPDMCSPQEGFAHCEPCNYALCHKHVNPEYLKVPHASELLYLRRFYLFIVTQLQHFYEAFVPWEFVIDEDGDIYRRMAYHYSQMIIRCAQNLAKPAMAHFDERRPLDDVRRCQDMDKFEDWRRTPFFMVTPHSYHVTSTSTFSPLQFIRDNEPDVKDLFHAWLEMNESVLQPVDRAQLQQMCSQLSQVVYSVDQKNPPLKTLIEVLGCWTGAMPILNAMDATRDKVGTTRLSSLDANVARVVDYLRLVGKLDNSDITCTEFKNVCSAYLNSLFGANTDEKPRYTLTADNILRIIALQMRLISGIPVCIMGETGCGKTETLHFLSNISGNDFKVINVQEGMTERDFYLQMKPHITQADNDPTRQIVVVLDEVNATFALWTAKDLLCDHICFGVRIPSNIVFVVILNPWKERTDKQQKAIAEMDVGGLDFLKYQQNANNRDTNTRIHSHNLVYQVHRSPETLYSLVWDWGSSSTTNTPLAEIRKTFEGNVLVKREKVTDELLMATSMVSWLIRKLENSTGLRNDFKQANDGTEGSAFWPKFRTILVELLLTSQDFLRHDVYMDEISVVSLRDIRKACELVDIILQNFWEVRVRLQRDQLATPFPYFRFLTNAVHVALVSTYCLRLDADRRLSYLIRVQKHWTTVRGWFSDIHAEFMPNPSPACPSYDECDMYKTFNELTTYIVSDLMIDLGIAVNQALKENTFAVLCAVVTKSTLFIVGRPGSTKSRSLELLVTATEERKGHTFLGNLGIVVQKHVIQCSPYTTAHHVHINVRRAAMAQVAADKIINSQVRRINVIVLEEVGATIGSVHNPLMSLHSLIDHGVELDGKHLRLPIIGVSNYRLDASKMGRGRVVYRGNPPLNDLELTARAILRGLGEASGGEWIKNFSLAFSENILRNEKFTWYYGMRDFYATVRSICILATQLEQTLQVSQLARTFQSEVNSHITRWAVLINLRGFPNKTEEQTLAEAMHRSFGLDPGVLAKWEWRGPNDIDSIRLCDCCAKMRLYHEALIWQSKHPGEELTAPARVALFRSCATPVMHQSYCQRFENETEVLPAAEVISFALHEITSRHVMVFTKANAALLLLFSMGLVQKEQCTVIFQSTSSTDQATTASELVQQMMRIKACMREGKTLILIKSRHLYESMLDALNVHYTKDRSSDDSDNLHRTMLSMSGVTQSVFVRPTFRCIVLEDQDELESSVLPPMINRFSKTVLTYASALNPLQTNVRTRILQQSRVEVDKDHFINLLQFLIPGLTEESLDSAIYAFSDFDKVVQHLCYCFSRKNLRRLSLKLVEGLDLLPVSVAITYWSHNWKFNRCNAAFKQIALDALQDCRHLMVITEQLQLSAASLAQALEAIFLEQDDTQTMLMAPNQMTILNQATSGDVYAALAALKKTPTPDSTSAMSVFILDTTSTTQSVQLDSFMYAVSSEKLDQHHHAVLIVVVSDLLAASTPQNTSFSLVFDTAWGQVFADEIVPRALGGELLSSSLLVALERDILLHEVLQPQLVFALVLEKDNLTTLCQSLSSSATNVISNLEAIRQLFLYDTPLRQQILESLIRNTMLAEISLEKWSKIAFQKAKFSSDSLRATYLNYLGGFVIRVLLQLFGVLMQFDSLQLAENADMMDIISNLMKSAEIVPQCDVESCLTLAPLSLLRSGDVESKGGFFLFPKLSRTMPGQLTKVSFPLSPFVATHIFNLGCNVDAITAFLNSVGLYELDSELRDKYFEDAMCLGTSVSVVRLALLKRIVCIFHPSAFDSIFNFHHFIANHTEWIKYTIEFCMDNFSEGSLQAFKGQTVTDLVNLAAIDGVVPYHRVDILCSVTHNDTNIDWRLVRAMAMIDSANTHTDYKDLEKGILVQLQAKFHNGEVEGIAHLLQHAPYYFIKYFFFEIFSEHTANAEVVEKTLSNLASRGDLKLLLDKHEDLQCGIAFLLRKALHLVFLQPEPEQSTMFVAVSEFVLAGTPHCVLASHCIFDTIFAHNILDTLDYTFVNKFAGSAPLCRLIRLGLAVAILILVPELSTVDATTYHELLDQLLQGKPEDIKQATLFVLRRLSSGGTVDLEKAVTEARGARYPPMISTCGVIDQVSRALQRVSPLACFKDFTSAVAALGEYAVAKTNENLDRYNAVCLEGKVACVGSYCALAAPKPIANFKAEIYAVATANFPPHATNVFQQLHNNQLLRNKPEQIRELVASLMLAIINDNKAAVVYQNTASAILAERAELDTHRKAIEDFMVPKCPRCKVAFVDWDGCFAVYCGNAACKCGFCGHCLQDCGTDAHTHIYQVHGPNPFGTWEQFRRQFGAIAATKIRNYVQSEITPRIKSLVEAEMPRILADNLFYVRPDQVIVQAAQGHGRAKDTPPTVGAILEILSCGGYIWDRVSKANSLAAPLDKLLTELQVHVTGLKALLFPDADSDASAFSWVHAIIWKLRGMATNDRKAVKDAVLRICYNYPNPLTLLAEFDNACRSHTSDVLSELQGIQEAELLQQPLNDNLYRTIMCMNRMFFDYKRQFWAHLDANYDTYPVLNFLHERALSISAESASRTLRILQFLDQIQQAARKVNVTRAYAASDGSFFQFIKERGEPLKSSVIVFEEDFKALFPLITHWQCKDNIHTLYGHMLNGLPKDVKLECFLPQQRGVGILAMTLWGGRNGDSAAAWAGLPLVQNRVYNIIHGTTKIAGSPYFLTAKDIIAVDTNSITATINELFIVPGFQPRLSADLPVAEDLCKYGAPRLALLPYVVTELPEYEYGLEGILDLFGKVQDRLVREPMPNGGQGNRGFTTLPSTLVGAVKALIKRVPHAAELIFSFCGAILVQQGGDDVLLGKEVSQINIGMPLTEDQQQGRQILLELPTALKAFHVDHIPAMMGLCWNSKNIHESANIAIEDQAETQNIVATLNKIVAEHKYHRQIPAILSSLRTAGCSLFSVEITAMFGSTPLLYYLTTIPIPLIEDDDELAEEALFQVHAKHFGFVLQEAEKILGPHEITTPVLEEANIVPFSAVRQFLGSHIIEENKPLPQNIRPQAPPPEANKNNKAPAPAINKPPVPAQQPRGRIHVSSSHTSDLEL